MRTTRQRIFAPLLALSLTLAAQQAAFGQATSTPNRKANVAKANAESSWFKQLAMQQGTLTNSRFDVVFIGDSLTEFWTSTGKTSWSEQFAPLKCANCGIAGDRTENILHRIKSLDFRRAAPRAFVVLMGTNNLGMENPDKPEDVARAALAATQQLAKRHPQSRVLLLGIPPSGVAGQTPLRTSIKQTNELLAKSSLPTQATFVPTYEIFADEADAWRDGLTLDGTHFSPAGYAKLANLLAPKLKEMLSVK